MGEGTPARGIIARNMSSSSKQEGYAARFESDYPFGREILQLFQAAGARTTRLSPVKQGAPMHLGRFEYAYRRSWRSISVLPVSSLSIAYVPRTYNRETCDAFRP